jgi:hypothetical protein
LFVDEGAWGAAVAAEHSGFPWAFSIVPALPLPSRDVPPFGLGLAPRHDLLGRLRGRAAKRLTLGTLDRLRGAVRRAIDLRPGAERIAAALSAAGGADAAADELERLVPERARTTTGAASSVRNAARAEVPQS